jgi:hypothetical protein
VVYLPQNNEDYLMMIAMDDASFSQTGSSCYSMSADESDNIQNILKNNTFTMRKKIPKIQRIVV